MPKKHAAERWELQEVTPEGSKILLLNRAAPPAAAHLVLGDISKADSEDCEIAEIQGRFILLRRALRFRHFPQERVVFYSDKSKPSST